MIPTQQANGHYWRTGDAADLSLGESGAIPPRLVQAFRIGHSGLVLSPSVSVDLQELNLLAKGFFGEARGTEGRKWTGDAYRYAVYTTNSKHRVVIIRMDGSGTRFYLVDELEAEDTWTQLAKLPSMLLWNLCSSVCHTYHRGQDEAKARIFQAFADGRLKKHKVRGMNKYQVSIVGGAKCSTD
jgi:hypothetical protein